MGRIGKMVFITKGSETYNGKPSVSFGKNASQINRSGKSFKDMPTAKKFACKKAKNLGLKSFDVLVSSGIKTIKCK